VILIATWALGQEEIDFMTPDSIRYENGTPATLAEYRDRMHDTSITLLAESGSMEQHIFSDIVADVRFSDAAGCWCVSGRGVIPKDLDLTDPAASDLEIEEQMSYSRFVYRIKVIR
jgi:hypothetical protein